MKKKLVAVLLSVSMAMVACIGCSQIADTTDTGATTESTPVGETDIAGEVVDTDETAIESMELVTVEISERGFDSLIQASDQYIFAYENGKYGLLNLAGEEVMPIEYDGYGGNMQDGCFCLGYKTSDTTWQSYIFDSNLQVRFQNAERPNYYFASYHEDVFELVEVSPEDGIADRLYVYANIDGQPGYVFNEESIAGYNGSSAINNGTIMIRTYTRTPEGTFGCMFNVADKLVQGPAWWTPFPYAQTDSGYINGVEFDPETGSSIGMAVYNAKNDTITSLPSDIVVTKVFSKDSITVTATEDGYMSVQNNPEGPLAIYNVAKQEYATEYKYGYVGIQKHDTEGIILVSNEDDTQWGYLDVEMNEVDAWYEDATDFSHGKAIIKDTDGLLYVVDSSLNKISEGFEGDSAAALGDIENRFVVYRGDKCYLLTVK